MHKDWVDDLQKEHSAEAIMFKAIQWWMTAASADMHFHALHLSPTDNARDRLLSLQDRYFETTGQVQNPLVVRIFTDRPPAATEPDVELCGVLFLKFPMHEQVFGLEYLALQLGVVDECSELLADVLDVTDKDYYLDPRKSRGQQAYVWRSSKLFVRSLTSSSTIGIYQLVS